MDWTGVYTGNWEFNGVLNRWLGIDSWGYGLTYETVYGTAVTGVWNENRLLQGMIFGIAVVLFAFEYHRGRRKHA